MQLFTVSQPELHSFQHPTTMPDSQSRNISSQEVFMSSTNNCILFRDLNDLTLKIVFDPSWASMNVGSKHPIAWHNATHALTCSFYLLWGIEETGGPGIISIISHEVLCHPSEHDFNSMGKHWPAKAHIVQLNDLTVFEVSALTHTTIDETA